MKQIFTLIFLLSFFFHGKSQENFPLPSEHPFWTESHAQLWACTFSFECGGYYCTCITPVYYKTDTVINNSVYNRLYTRGVCDEIFAGGPPPYGCPFTFDYTQSESLFAIIRQDTANKTVYLWDNVKDTLLYDFKNMTAGLPYPPTVNNPMQNNLLVVSVDSVELNNVYYKKWNLGINWEGTTTDSAFAYIIEGIGSSLGILANLVPPFENSDQLICFSENDVSIYPDSTYYCDKTVNVIEKSENQFFKIYPNPTEDNLTIETDFIFENSAFIKILNTNGKVLDNLELKQAKTDIKLAGYPSGIYFVQIVNGTFIETLKFIKK